MKKILSLLFITCSINSCSYQLLAPIVSVHPTITHYAYVYIIPTNTITSGYDYDYSNSYLPSGITKSINPADIIAGDLMQRGYAVLPSLQEQNINKTMVVSYGETGTRTIGLFAYTKEIIIQFRDATTNELIASCKAEGIGSTEADDIQEAIRRALNAIFTNTGNYTHTNNQ